MGFFLAVYEWGVKKEPLSTKSVTLSHISCNNETWHNYTLSKGDPKKYINHVTQPVRSADIKIILRKSRNRDIYCIMIRNL